MEMPSPSPIYLDHHSTTPVDPRVGAAVMEAMTVEFGNANSVEHLYGEVAASRIEDARQEVSMLVGAQPGGVHFTSGATDSIQLALSHVIASHEHRPLRIALTSVEHSAVLDAVAIHRRRENTVVKEIPVDGQGRVDMSALQKFCNEGLDLVCVLAASNEVGTINPIEEIANIVYRCGAQLLLDSTQAVGRIPIKTDEWGITYLTVSAHKIYGPKGIGALVVPPDFHVRPGNETVPGTGPGTPNVPGIIGLGKACLLRRLEMNIDEPRMALQRDCLQETLLSKVKGLVINGDSNNRLSNNLHISVPGILNDAVIARLRPFVSLSTGAACSSGTQAPSHVLTAMGLADPLLDGALRMGTGKFTSDSEIEEAGIYIARAISETRKAFG